MADYAGRNFIWNGQIKPRLKSSLFPANIVLLTLLVGAMVTVVVVYSPGGSMPISRFAEVGLSFSSISFAGCLAVLALSLSLPSRELVNEWAQHDDPETGFDVYTELVFSLFWAALAQLAFVLMCATAFVFGGDYRASPGHLIDWHNFWALMAYWLASYCFRELYTVVRTAFQIANVTVLHIRLGSEN